MGNKKLKDNTELIDVVTNINGKDYYNCKVFAELTNRSEQAIRLLILNGNRIRKLKAIKVGTAIFIDKTELTEFPFCLPGRNKVIKRFNEKAEEYIEVR